MGVGGVVLPPEILAVVVAVRRPYQRVDVFSERARRIQVPESDGRLVIELDQDNGTPVSHHVVLQYRKAPTDVGVEYGWKTTLRGARPSLAHLPGRSSKRRDDSWSRALLRGRNQDRQCPCGTYTTAMIVGPGSTMRPSIRALSVALCSAAAVLALSHIAGASRTSAAGQPQPSAETPLEPLAVYDELRKARLASAGRIEQGLLRLDRFDITLDEGDLFLLEPAGGRVTGAVFLGRGSIRAYPPDAVEHQQLKKHLKSDLLEERFSRLVLRFSDDDLAERVQAMAVRAETRRDRAEAVYEERHDELFRRQLYNADSRVLADLLDDAVGASKPDGRARYALALVDSDRRGWLTVEIEPRNLEEVQLSRYDRRLESSEVLMGFHVSSDFDLAEIPDPWAGFAIDPASVERPADRVTGVDLGLPVRPLEPSREGWKPRAEVPLVTADVSIDSTGKVKGTAALLIQPLQHLGALRLRISPLLEVTDVRWRTAEDVDAAGLTVGGAEAVPSDEGLDLLAGRPQQARTGPVAPIGERVHAVQERRARRLDENHFEPWVTVALPRLFSPDEPFIVEIAYEGKVVERLRTRDEFVLRDTLYWIPGHPDSRHSRFYLTFRVPRREDVAASGDRVADSIEGGMRIIRYVKRTPARFASFHVGRFNVTEVETVDGLPVQVFESRRHLGFSPGITARTTDDLIGSLGMYRDYFGPYPFGSLLVTETPAAGGQAFAGLVLLSYQAFGELHTGEAQLFRSHEVAHQWWGVGVGWEHYRDQWLSEGFAHYSAALYVLAGLGNDRQFREILSAWRRDVLGEIDMAQAMGGRRYGFQPAALRRSQGARSGPLVAGVRLRSGETPFDYRLIVYEKGALVLHMLRAMLLDPETGEDTRFREMMRRFAVEYMHGVASTRAFEDAVSEAFGEPMGWFFDQWVYGVAVPTYRPALRVSPDPGDDGTYVLHGTIAQEDVPAGFRMPVPVAVHFADGPPLVHQVWVDAETVDVEVPLSARPSRVEFNYLDAVLARVR